MEPIWIKLVKMNKQGIPRHAHPDSPGTPIRLLGSFHVRWPDGTVGVAELKTKMVHTRLRDQTEVSGLYSFFEVPFNGMDIIYDLHEIELMADEVAKSLAATKRKAA
jgi:hypothetical protein